MLERYGGLAVFFGRFSGVLRPVLLFTIGTMQVPYRRFWIYETAGAAAWTTLWLGMGVVGGSVLDYFGISGFNAMLLLALKVAAFGIGGAILWRYRERVKEYVFGAKASSEEAAQPAA
jgi:membrane protein DedA with SNARE-associated domain